MSVPGAAAEPFRICFVCLGNICRSPTAEGVMRHLVEEAGLADRFEVHSAGTAGYHIGDPPDPRTVAEAARRGLDLSGLRGSRFHRGDAEWYDLVLAMDGRNLAHLVDLAPDQVAAGRIRLLRSFDPESVAAARQPGDLDVPDPYLGGRDGFAHVYDLVESACRGLLAHLAPGTPHAAG